MRKLSKIEALLSSHSLIPDGLFSYLIFFLRQPLKLYHPPSFSARFHSTWFTSVCLPSAVCPKNKKRRRARSSTCCDLQLPPLFIWNSIRNEKPQETERENLWLMKYFPGTVTSLCVRVCVSHLLTSANDAQQLHGDALCFYDTLKSSWSSLLYLQSGAFPVETGYHKTVQEEIS